MVEAAVLGIDHDDRLDPGERVGGAGRVSRRDDTGAGAQQEKRGGAENAYHGGDLSRVGLPRSYTTRRIVR